MNALAATEAKINRALVARRWRRPLAQAQERGSQQIDHLLVRVPGRIGRGESFRMTHAERSVRERR